MLRYFDKKYILLFILVLMTFSFKAQISSRSDKKTLLKADDAFDFGDYLTAMRLYEKLYPLDSNNNEMNFKLGVCNYELKKYREHSKKYFNKVSPFSYPEVNYYQGRLHHLAGKYEKSISYFNRYKAFKGDKEHTLKEIDELIKKCNAAMLFESKPNETIKITNLGNTINTEYAEYAPLIPAEENFILFTSRRKNPVWQKLDPLGDYYEDVYISPRKENTWQPVVMLDSNINTAVHDACTGLSADGERLLIYRTSKDLRSGDIYESFYVNKKWSAPSMLGANVNSEDLETSACYSPNGDIIFFSSNRPGGFGGKDLYLVRKLPNGKWGEPFNLGSDINTEYNEDAPFVHPTGNILFFSSEGHKNMGGYDIFKSVFNEGGNFTTPENLGYPINTTDDDIFFVLNTDASQGYLSSERSGGFGSQDIYSVYFSENNIPLNVYNVRVTDSLDNVIKKVEMVVTDMEKGKIYGVYKSNELTGKLWFISKPDRTYRIALQADGFEPLIINAYTVGGTGTEVSFVLSK